MRSVRAEWTKLRTLPGAAWLLAALAVLTIGLSAVVAWSLDGRGCTGPAGCDPDLTRFSLAGVYAGQVAAAVLGALAATSDYASGTIRPTMLANPRRGEVLAAKAAVVTGLVLAAALLGVLGSVLAGRLLLPGNGFTPARGYQLPSLADGPTLRAAAGTVLYLTLVALLALGLGMAVRDTAATLTAVLALLFLTPMLAPFVTDPVWQRRLDRSAPMTAGLAVQATKRLAELPIGPWAGLSVLAGWAAAGVLAGAARFVATSPPPQ